jgi:uncharacterized protein YlxW (UPF0749 family)
LEEQISGLRTEESVLRRDNADLSTSLQDEQKKVAALTQELSTNTSSRQVRPPTIRVARFFLV